MHLEFPGEIWSWRGPSPFHFITVPDDGCAAIWGPAPVVNCLTPSVQREAFRLIEGAGRRAGHGSVFDGREPDVGWRRGDPSTIGRGTIRGRLNDPTLDECWAEAALEREVGGRSRARRGAVHDVLAQPGLVAEMDDV
ncbi:MAG: hypothetical protein ACXWNR_09395 [Candidatus Limnocylindrales bacterium]